MHDTRVMADMSRDRPAAAMTVTLVEVHTLAAGTNLYVFERAGGGPLPPAEAGAHVILQLPNRLVRQYSLVHPDPSPTRHAIGVKRDPASRGGSQFMHETLKIGDQLRMLPPRNLFALDETATDTVLFAGGIGITPIYAMIQRLRDLNRRYTVHYGCRSVGDMAFHGDLSADPNAHLHFDVSAGHPLPILDRVTAAPRHAHLYCCGPAPMLAAFEAAVAAHARVPELVHVEYFKPKSEPAASSG